MALTNSLAINSLYSFRAPLGLFYHLTQFTFFGKKFFEISVFDIMFLLKNVKYYSNMHSRGTYEKRRHQLIKRMIANEALKKDRLEACNVLWRL